MIRSHLYVILHVETRLLILRVTPVAMQHSIDIDRQRETDRDKLRVRLAMLLIDRARSMYICVQLYVRYKHMYNNRRERRSNVV